MLLCTSLVELIVVKLTTITTRVSRWFTPVDSNVGDGVFLKCDKCLLYVMLKLFLLVWSYLLNSARHANECRKCSGIMQMGRRALPAARKSRAAPVAYCQKNQKGVRAACVHWLFTLHKVAFSLIQNLLIQSIELRIMVKLPRIHRTLPVWSVCYNTIKTLWCVIGVNCGYIY